MLIETSGSRMDHDEEKLNKFLQYVMEKRLVLDGTCTNDPAKMKVRTLFYVEFTAVSYSSYGFKIFTANLSTFFFLLSSYFP